MLSVSNLAKSFGEQLLFSGMTFNVGSRDRIAVIGPNGSGKTTLFEIIVGNMSAGFRQHLDAQRYHHRLCQTGNHARFP